VQPLRGSFVWSFVCFFR